MKKYIPILFLLILSLYVQSFAQYLNTGVHEVFNYENYTLKSRLVTVPEPVDKNNHTAEFESNPFLNSYASNLRWNFLDAAAISYHSAMAGNGLYAIVAWDLNSKRNSLYGNANSTPLWEYTVSSQTGNSYVAISDTAGSVAVGAYQNIWIFSRQNNTPFFTYNLSSLPDTGTAGPLDITSNGNYLIACASRSDTSSVLAFSKDSNVPLWKYRVPTAIQGIKLSGNDSLVIVNTYSAFWVFRTYTGQMIYQGTIQYGTQTKQGINGDGSILGIIDYRGWLRVFQWNGTTYNMLWQSQEVPGTYYNWLTAVDVSYYGQYVAVGTLNFLTGNTYDGKIKYYKVSSGSTPLWQNGGLGDEVNAVAFSKNSKVLIAAAWGDMDNAKNDFFAFFVSDQITPPIFSYNSPGSLFDCSISDGGTSVITGGKKVHARTFGSGGELYNIFIDTLVVGINPVKEKPVSFKLGQNYPNPFNPTTTIKYEIPLSFPDISTGNPNVVLKIYDLLGKEIAVLVNQKQEPGAYEVTFDAGKLASGVYYYKLQAGDFVDVKSMVYLK